MTVHIGKGVAVGTVAAPPSKSMAHRMLICAGLAAGESKISGISDSEDIAATIDCLRALGVDIAVCGDVATVRGIDLENAAPTAPLRCRESGSTLRFLVPPALLCGKEVHFVGSRTLLSRPLSVYETLCAERGMTFLQDENGLTVCGKLTAGEFRVPGNISSQFISGLLFTLPLLAGDSVIRITSPVESRSYIDLTVAALAAFGVTVQWTDERTITVAGGQHYRAHDAAVEGDYSGAAFFEALNVLGGRVTVTGLSADSLQGDRVYARHFESLKKGTPAIHLADCPDLGPVLFAVAAAKFGGVFTGTRRLKIKESDRAAAMAEELQKCGVAVTVYEDSVVVFPKALHPPTEPLCGHNDHRIVMALAVLLTALGGEITGAEAVAKSFPDFFERLSALGVEVVKHDTE